MIILRNLHKTRNLKNDEKSRSYQSADPTPPMSYFGSTRRILVWASKPRSMALTLTGRTVSVPGIMLIMVGMTCWYMIWGHGSSRPSVPRQQRKSLHFQRAQLAAKYAVMAGRMKQPEEQ